MVLPCEVFHHPRTNVEAKLIVCGWLCCSTRIVQGPSMSQRVQTTANCSRVTKTRGPDVRLALEVSVRSDHWSACWRNTCDRRSHPR